MMTKGGWRTATRNASIAEPASPRVAGTGTRSTRPAAQAAGSMARPSATKPSTHARHPNPSASTWPRRGAPRLRHGGGEAGQRNPDHHARPEHDPEDAVSGRQHREAAEIGH